MSARRGGLGRGLESLIPGIGGDAGSSGAANVDIGSLEPNPLQPRVRWDDEQLESLATSIREHGIIQPIVVSRHGRSKPFQIIAGERRWRAAQRAGLASVPILVREVTAAQLLELALVEYIQRADLNPIEEALAYRQLTDEFGLKQAEIAQRVGKSRPAVANTMRLLTAPEPIREAVANEEITAGHAKALLAIENPELQLRLLKQVIREGLTVRQTERLAQQAVQFHRTKPSIPEPDPAVRSLETELQRALGTSRVELVRGRKGGRIVVHYFSDEELTSIVNRIAPSEEDWDT